MEACHPEIDSFDFLSFTLWSPFDDVDSVLLRFLVDTFYPIWEGKVFFGFRCIPSFSSHAFLYVD